MRSSFFLFLPHFTIALMSSFRELGHILRKSNDLFIIIEPFSAPTQSKSKSKCMNASYSILSRRQMGKVSMVFGLLSVRFIWI